jgi:hypothetical protein
MSPVDSKNDGDPRRARLKEVTPKDAAVPINQGDQLPLLAMAPTFGPWR